MFLIASYRRELLPPVSYAAVISGTVTLHIESHARDARSVDWEKLRGNVALPPATDCTWVTIVDGRDPRDIPESGLTANRTTGASPHRFRNAYRLTRTDEGHDAFTGCYSKSSGGSQPLQAHRVCRYRGTCAREIQPTERASVLELLLGSPDQLILQIASLSKYSSLVPSPSQHG